MEEEKVEPEDIVDVKPKREPNNTSEIVRLTPTGKISHAKTRVYTQRYRKEWEHMTDFKDWLSSVPFQATRAFCKYCQRNLHAHRLSLLKHMCTLKHQRAAIQYNKKHAISSQQDEDISNDMNYIVERLDDEEEEEEEDLEITYEGSTYVHEGEEVSIESETQEEIVIETEHEEDSQISKKIRLQKDHHNDSLAQAMAHVQSDYLTESDEPIELQMVDESDENNEVVEKTFEVINYEDLQNSKSQFAIQKEILTKGGKYIKVDSIQKPMNSEEMKTTITLPEIKNSTITSDSSKKVYYFSTGGKSYTLVKSKLPQILLNQLNDKNFSVFAKPTKNDVKNCKDVITQLNSTLASTSQESTNKNIVVTNNPSIVSTKSVLIKKPIVSTHVLETSRGIPVCGLQVSLYKLQDGRWTFIHECITTASGNCNNFLSTVKNNLSTGRYKLHYDVEKYYKMRKIATIYPFIEIVFDIKDPNSSYHIPLLLSPFSYSTYKDSHR